MPRSSRLKANLPESGVIGWISISEVFLLCGVTMLGLAMAVEFKRKEATSHATDIARENEKLVEERKQWQVHRKQYDEERAKWDQERRDLGARLAEAESGRDALLGRLTKALAERDALARDLDSMKADVDRLRAKLAELKTVLAGELAEVASLKKDLAEKQARVTSLEGELAAKRADVATLRAEVERLKGSIFSPLGSAKVIVKVSCKAFPANLDLDLHVQDPNNQHCYFAAPRIQWRNTEAGLLMLSEDIQRVNQGEAEEIFYSSTLLPSNVTSCYLVSCMIREKRPTQPPPRINLAVRWEVSMDVGQGLKVIGRGERQITELGDVLYRSDGTYSFPGMVSLVGCYGSPGSVNSPRVFARKGTDRFRGWVDGAYTAGGLRFIKSRDQ